MSFWDEVYWTAEDVGKIIVDPFGLWVNDTNGETVIKKEDLRDVILLPGTVVDGFESIGNNVVNTVGDSVDNVVNKTGDVVGGLGEVLSTPLLIIGLAFVLMNSK